LFIQLFDVSAGQHLTNHFRASALLLLIAFLYILRLGLQGCQIFLDTIYQYGGNSTTLLLNYQICIPNGHNIFQTAIEYTNLFHSNALQKIAQIEIFGVKIYHLATLLA
jgi:hypothetical protein